MIRSRLGERFGDSFTLRIFFYLAVPMLIVSACFVLNHLRRERALATRAFVQQGNAVLRLFARGAQSSLFAQDRVALRSLAAGLIVQGDYLSVRFFGPDQRLLLQSDAGETLDSRQGMVGWEGGNGVTASLPSQFASTDGRGELVVIRGEHQVEFWVAIYAPGTYGTVEQLYYDLHLGPGESSALGYLGVLASLHGVHAQLRHEAARYVLLTLLFVAIGGFVSLVVASEATRPLRRLVRQVRQVRSGDDTPEPSTSRDGIELLTSRFATLVTELNRSFVTIRRFNRELEARVAARTGELADANTRLVREVAERRRAQKELQQAHDELEQRVTQRTAELERTHAQLRHAEKLAAVGRLSASLAHEFNNPLCGVRNCIAELRHGLPADGEEAKIAELALAECKRMAGLVANLRPLSRPSPEHVAAVDPSVAVTAMLQLTRKEFERAGIHVVTEYQPDLPPVRVPEDQFKQVLLNLLQNARDAIDGVGGSVHVRIYGDDGRVAVAVRDEGGGIEAEHLPHIFEPFYSTKDAVKGTGLGLSVSYGIVEQFGGEILVESTPGDGSTFTLRLPVAEEAA